MNSRQIEGEYAALSRNIILEMVFEGWDMHESI